MDDADLRILDVDGFAVGFTDSGGPGPVVLLVHAGGFSGWFRPLVAEPALEGMRVIRLVRAGYGDLPAPGRILTLADHARHAAAVLDELGLSGATVVGHSSGSAIVLQLVLDRPDVAARLVLAEPPLVDVLLEPADVEAVRALFGPMIGAALAAAARGDDDAGFDAFMDLVCGPGHRAVIAATLGADAVATAVRESRFFLGNEIPAIQGWSFGPGEAGMITTPTTFVEGHQSPEPTHRMIRHLAGLMPPGARIVTLPGTNHLLPLQAPAALAEVVVEAAKGAPVA
jgi:pimeloyl-ACP methyl ester carboxylesterase